MQTDGQFLFRIFFGAFGGGRKEEEKEKRSVVFSSFTSSLTFYAKRTPGLMNQKQFSSWERKEKVREGGWRSYIYYTQLH